MQYIGLRVEVQTAGSAEYRGDLASESTIVGSLRGGGFLRACYERGFPVLLMYDGHAPGARYRLRVELFGQFKSPRYTALVEAGGLLEIENTHCHLVLLAGLVLGA